MSAAPHLVAAWLAIGAAGLPAVWGAAQTVVLIARWDGRTA